MKMFRRRFLQLVTVATAGGLAPLDNMAKEAGTIVTYRVKGFSCITCATGLDTMLSQQKGITSSKSTYPEGTVTVGFDPGQTTEKAIVAFISDLGFTVEGEPKGNLLPASRPRQSKPSRT
jgi:Cu+-exporting ATPase